MVFSQGRQIRLGNPRGRTRPTGFALVVTLSLMILLTIIAVGLLTLSSVSLRASSQNEAMATAKSHARLALMMAIGDLQKSLGPDKAISASSAVLAESPSKPNTTGVWESWDFNPSGGALDYTGEKKNRFRRWLVSNPDPTEAESMDFASAPWKGGTIELVGNASLGGNAPAGDKAVAGTVPVSRDGKIEGTFAWHVADESVKARINLYRDPRQNTTLAKKRALLAGQRPSPSVIKDTDGGALDFLPTDVATLPTATAGSNYDKAKETVPKILDLDQVELHGAAKGRIKQFRNDVTPYSLGLLTDVRRGGLKEDLSSVFEMNTALPAEFASKRLYQATHGITGVSDPYWSTLSGYYNSFRSITSPESNPTFYQKPLTDTLMTNLAPPTAYYPGPVIAKIETLFSFVSRESHGMWTPLLTGQDANLRYMGHLILTPIITLHNPYNINLSFDQLDVTYKNLPVGFKFYVNGQAQDTQLVSMNSLYWDDNLSQDRVFIIGIANWSNYTSTDTSKTGPIVMKPGQTLVCGLHVDPNITFGNGNGKFIVSDRDLRGEFVKASPGYRGRCVGYDLDVLSPVDYSPPEAQQSDRVHRVLGLKPDDSIHMEFAIVKPPNDPSAEFQVLTTLTSNGATKKYGGLSFKYQNDATLKSLFPKTYRYPASGTFMASEAHVSNTIIPDAYISNHAQAKTVAIFSAYARTANGGVYETGKRSLTAGAVNALRDGRLAGKPYLFHNPARTVVALDLKTEKPSSQSHELNLQPLPGSVDDVLPIDNLNRSPYLTANTETRGIKSGSYLELPTGPMQTIAGFRRSNALTSSYLPTFVQPVGNSQVSPLMSTDKVKQVDAAAASYVLLDHSVLANQAFYDRFYFSTFATRGTTTPDAVFEQFMNGSAPLASQAFQPYLPAGQTAATAKTELFSSGKPKNTAYQIAAEYQTIQGPFNVNSTSVQAWKAVLAALNKSEIVTLWSKTGALETRQSVGIPIPSMTLQNGGLARGAVNFAKIDNAKTNDWNGCRELTDYELETLAAKIVDQVRLRGPFLSMAEFVNRRIGPKSAFTLAGALESAINQSGINQDTFKNQVTQIEMKDISDPTMYRYATPESSLGNPAAGAPGWISQGDLMQILEPAATVRSDTFVIRVCGEAMDPAGKVTARAYAEAVVQRIPEFVDPVDRPSLNVYTNSSAAAANKSFGRRMTVVSFRWLSAKEI
jgi:hypothetical protein